MKRIQETSDMLVTADFIYAEDRLQTDWGLLLDSTGIIQACGPAKTLSAPEVLTLKGGALFPGFVNTHSHAFQRLIRGRTSTVPVDQPEADFWSWRERMYQAALRLTPEELEAVTAFCYLEMLRAGITSVAEFHYLHNDLEGQPYADPNLLSKAVLRAAARVGLRITLLPVAYHRGGFGIPAGDPQRRFTAPDLESFLGRVDELRQSITEGTAHAQSTLRGEVGKAREAAQGRASDEVDALQGGEQGVLTGASAHARLGLAAHSVRAIPEDWLGPLKAYASRWNMPLHIHANEQIAEIDQSVAATGLRPIELLSREDALDGLTFIVHATHLSDNEKELLARHGSSVCVCPTTERDLGDGILDAKGLLDRGIPLSLGSDSHVQLDFFAEMRCLEGHERLARQKRNVLARAERGVQERSVVPPLLKAATRDGAPALGLPVGAFEVGRHGDGFTVDLDAFELEGADRESLAGQLIAAGTPSMVREVLVGGKPALSRDGAHPEEARIREEFREVCRRLWA